MTALARAAAVHVVDALEEREASDWVLAHTVDMLARRPRWGAHLVISGADPAGHRWCRDDTHLRAVIDRHIARGEPFSVVGVAQVLAEQIAGELDDYLNPAMPATHRWMDRLFPAPTENSPDAANTRAERDQNPSQENQPGEA